MYCSLSARLTGGISQLDKKANNAIASFLNAMDGIDKCARHKSTPSMAFRCVQGFAQKVPDAGEDVSRKGAKTQSATAFLMAFFGPLREK